MRRPLAVLACLALLAGLAVACGGGGGGDGGSTTSSTRPTATRSASSGPSASINPKSGPPGIEVTTTGTGWPAVTEVTITAVSPGSKPYTTAFTDRDGTFRATFFLEKKPDGSALETGRLDIIIASAGATNVTIPYIVEVRRPVSGPGPGG